VLCTFSTRTFDFRKKYLLIGKKEMISQNIQKLRGENRQLIQIFRLAVISGFENYFYRFKAGDAGKNTGSGTK